MSFPRFPPPTPEEAARRVAGARDRIEQAIEQQDMLYENDEGVAEAPRKRGIAGRLRSVFVRGNSPPGPPEAEVSDSDEDVWARERQRRREHEQNPLDGGG